MVNTRMENDGWIESMKDTRMEWIKIQGWNQWKIRRWNEKYKDDMNEYKKGINKRYKDDMNNDLPMERYKKRINERYKDKCKIQEKNEWKIQG